MIHQHNCLNFSPKTEPLNPLVGLIQHSNSCASSKLIESSARSSENSVPQTTFARWRLLLDLLRVNPRFSPSPVACLMAESITLMKRYGASETLTPV